MIAPPRLIAISDSTRSDFEPWLGQLESLLARAAPDRVLVMLRDRQLDARERLALGERLRELTRRHGQRLSVNDRLDLALLLDADAVHLSESSVDPSDVRSYASRHARSFWVSRALHVADDAARTDADALLLSPIAEARKGNPPLGVAGIASARAALGRRTSAAAPCALYALGGITSATAETCLNAGADGVALIGALLEPDAPRLLVERLRIAR
ncbi:MAG TPA: thiamine phosphate synthase [Polyangiaceae bacterium]|nr:thiamine phosphate synthase [Polyangiaceae bacterium]